MNSLLKEYEKERINLFKLAFSDESLKNIIIERMGIYQIGTNDGDPKGFLEVNLSNPDDPNKMILTNYSEISSNLYLDHNIKTLSLNLFILRYINNCHLETIGVFDDVEKSNSEIFSNIAQKIFPSASAIIFSKTYTSHPPKKIITTSYSCKASDKYSSRRNPYTFSATIKNNISLYHDDTFSSTLKKSLEKLAGIEIDDSDFDINNLDDIISLIKTLIY